MSRRILVLSALGLVVCGYFIFFRDRNDLVYLFALFLLIGTISYIFQYQIDQLMTRGVAQTLDHSMRQMLIQTSPWFARLTVPQQRMMEDRMKRWVVKKDFINKHDQDAPEDVKYILAFYAVMLTLHQEKFLYEDLDRVAFYHHPFLSPAYPDDVHIGEVEMEDGTMIISVPHLIKGHFEKGYYNLGLHMMAEAYQKVYLKKNIEWPGDIWEKLEEVSSVSRDALDAYMGIPVMDPWPVAVHHEFIYGAGMFEQVLTELPQLRRYASAVEADSSNR